MRRPLGIALFVATGGVLAHCALLLFNPDNLQGGDAGIDSAIETGVADASACDGSTSCNPLKCGPAPSISCQGGDCVNGRCQPFTIASGLASPNSVAIDPNGVYVYWATARGVGFATVDNPKATPVGPESRTWGMINRGTVMFWFETDEAGASIERSILGTDAAFPIYAGLDMDAGFGVIVPGSYLYWTDDGHFVRESNDPTTFTDSGLGPANVLVSDAGQAGPVAAYATTLWYADGNQIMQCVGPTKCFSLGVLIGDAGKGGIQALAAALDSKDTFLGFIYWSTGESVRGAKTDAAVVSEAIDASTVVALAFESPYPQYPSRVGLVLATQGGSGPCTTATMAEAGAIVACAFTVGNGPPCGPPITLASHETCPVAVAVNATSSLVVWATSGDPDASNGTIRAVAQ